MSEPWLHIIGVTEDGPGRLPDASVQALAKAQVIFGGPRHLALVGAGARGQAWPVPFSLEPVFAAKGRRVVVLASGDPFWHGAGSGLAERLEPEEWRAIPAVSAPALAAAHLGWRQERVHMLGLHAAPMTRLRPHLHQGARIIATLRDGAAGADLAAYLEACGMGASRVWFMEALGGPQARIRETRADRYALDDLGPLLLAAIEVAGAQGLPTATGLADDLFAHDGQITKRPVRALTLSALAPRPDALLWDLGAGSGSISVEWARAGGRAMALEPRADRVAQIRQNAAHFGLDHRITVHQGRWPDDLEGDTGRDNARRDASPPDAVFLGGGATPSALARLWQILPAGVRVVANAVTLETESLLLEAHARLGGDLMRIDLAHVAPLGAMRGWQHARPIVQWCVTR